MIGNWFQRNHWYAKVKLTDLAVWLIRRLYSHRVIMIIGAGYTVDIQEHSNSGDKWSWFRANFRKWKLS